MALSPSTGWQKYAELSINNPSINYQMRLEVRRGSSQNNDPQQGIIYDDYNCYYDDLRDVRIGTSDDPAIAEQLPMWAEEVQNGIKRVIWIKTDGNSLLYLFVGNLAADEYSDGNATFIYFDDFVTDTTGEYTPHTASDGKAHSFQRWDTGYERKIIAKIKITNWQTGTWGSSIRFGYSDDICWYDSSNACMGQINNDRDNGATADAGVIASSTKINGTVYAQKTTFPLTLNKYYLFEFCFLNYEIVTKIFDGNSLLASIGNASMPTSLPQNNLIELWHCNEGGSTYDFSWNSGEQALRMYVKRDSTFSLTDSLCDFIAIGKYLSTEPAWQSFSAWKNVTSQQFIDILDAGKGMDWLGRNKSLNFLEIGTSIEEIKVAKVFQILDEGTALEEILKDIKILIDEAGVAMDELLKDGLIIISEIGNITEIISIQGIEDKLSNLHVKPARVVTTHFPAVAGLPSDKKIRIYAKAVSGQEKEIILEAIT